MCEEVGIKFIGPSAKVMDLMGDKINARKQMIKAGVPVLFLDQMVKCILLKKPSRLPSASVTL